MEGEREWGRKGEKEWGREGTIEGGRDKKREVKPSWMKHRTTCCICTVMTLDLKLPPDILHLCELAGLTNL